MKIEKYDERDKQQIVTLINDVWGIDKYIPQKKDRDALLHNFCSLLQNEMAMGYVVKEDEKIIGCIILNLNKIKYSLKKIIFWSTFYIRYLFGSIFFPKDTKLFINEYTKVFKAYKQLDQQTKHFSFDGEIGFFMVSPLHQGKGIGRSLLSTAKDFFQEKNCRHIYLYTDTTCNYGFYDRCGFEQLSKMDINLYPFDLSLKERRTIMKYSIATNQL